MKPKERWCDEAKKQREKSKEREKAKEKGRDKSTSSSSSERNNKSAAEKEKEESGRAARQHYATEVVERISFRQENFFIQLISLEIQLNLVVGNEPLEAYGMYPSLVYSMLALIHGLQMLAKFSSQPPSLSSSRLVLGVKHLLLDIERIGDDNLKELLQVPGNLEFPKEEEIFVEAIQRKLKGKVEITVEDAEMLKAQSLRTKSLIEEWTGLFEPFKNSYKHKILDSLGRTSFFNYFVRNKNLRIPYIMYFAHDFWRLRVESIRGRSDEILNGCLEMKYI